MVELIAKISKGTKMDQIYIPKNRFGFSSGSYVVIRPIELIEKKDVSIIYYNIDYLEPQKIQVIKDIFLALKETIDPKNMIITGSFLEKGFNFNDIDVIMIHEKEINKKDIENLLSSKTGINIHLVNITNKALIKGLSTDPLFNLMLSKCVSNKRLIYNNKKKLNYKLLDLHLLKSQLLIDNFDILNGKEKYEIIRNLIAIKEFIGKEKITKEAVDKEITKIFNIEKIDKIKNNILEKKGFINKYKQIYNKTKEMILEGIKNEPKSK